MKQVLVATKNAGKVKEFQQLFQSLGVKVRSLLDDHDAADVEETGTTFAENAILKAETISRKMSVPVIADDSGLVIDALNGRPGVYSARYAGKEKNDRANIDKVMAELDGVPLEKRTARFVCVLALAIPGERTKTYHGTCEGLISLTRSGQNGFGYDPIFYVPSKGKTMAEMSKKEKNAISHRSEALNQLLEHWRDSAIL
ncbi:MAG TPA: XTP/dITP diphosphatase [Bacillales bacterium]|nr:XTP/dITP diphosphatase [Bacillales bacterium]